MTRQLLGIVMVLAGVGAIVVSHIGSVNGAVLTLALVMAVSGALLTASTPRRGERR